MCGFSGAFSYRYHYSKYISKINVRNNGTRERDYLFHDLNVHTRHFSSSISKDICVKPPTLKAPTSFIHICEHEPGSSHSLISSHLVLLTSLYLLGGKKK